MIINSKCLLFIYTLFSLVTLNTNTVILGAKFYSANTPKITQADIDVLKKKVSMAAKAWNDHLDKPDKKARDWHEEKSDWTTTERKLYKAYEDAGKKLNAASRRFEEANEKAKADQAADKNAEADNTLDGDTKENESGKK
jgi:hypothetical protein